jgi:general stress protein 26
MDIMERTTMKELVGRFGAAMLTTHSHDGHLRARPMTVPHVDDEGDLWFATRVDLPKVWEIEEDHVVNVTMQQANQFLSLSGTAHIVVDRATLERLWDDSWLSWFPDGKDTEMLGLIHITLVEGEFWTERQGKQVRMHFEPNRPLQRRQPDVDQGEQPKTA